MYPATIRWSLLFGSSLLVALAAFIVWGRDTTGENASGDGSVIEAAGTADTTVGSPGGQGGSVGGPNDGVDLPGPNAGVTAGGSDVPSSAGASTESGASSATGVLPKPSSADAPSSGAASVGLPQRLLPSSPSGQADGSVPPNTASTAGPARDPNRPSGSPTTVRPTTSNGVTTRPKTTVDAAPSSTDGKLIWEDNFTTFNEKRWAKEHSTYGDGNHELQCYEPENVSVTNGKLVLRAKKKATQCPNGGPRSYSSGMVRSRGVTFGPGQAIEFRIKLTPGDPNAQAGLWPAVWSSSWAPGGWPKGGELDFIEVMTAVDPTRSVYSAHFEDRRGEHALSNKAVKGDQNFSAAWHTVRFHYGRNGQLVWFLDGKEVFSVDHLDTAQGYPTPFDRAIGEIKINLALGGRPGPLDDRALSNGGAVFEVDYIKVFQL